MKRIYYLFILSLLINACEKPISDWQSHNFIKYFGSGYESKGNDVIELSDGTYVIAGFDKQENADYQLLAAKVDKNGNLIWSKTYGLKTAGEEAKIVKEVSDGFLFAGTSTGSTGIIHSFILKIDQYGDSVWYKEFGNPALSIVVNDFITNEENIFVAGESYQSGNSKSDYYTAKLTLSGEKVWEWDIFFPNSNSNFERIFLQSQNILFIGTDGNNNKISMVTSRQSDGFPIDFQVLETENETVADVFLNDNQIFILSNIGTTGTRLSKLGLDFVYEWQTETISSVTGKSFAQNDDKSILIMGETTEDASSLININTIRVDDTGNAEYGSGSFRTLPGNISRVKPTKDKGVILIGTTNATFGANAQLIKTDEDLFLLKP